MRRVDIRKAVDALFFCPDISPMSISALSVRLYSTKGEMNMPQFVLMLRDSGAAFPDEMSAEDIQQILEGYGAWAAKVQAQGQKLRDGEGRVIVRKDGGVAVTDGPYVESKEVIGGYFLIDAPDYESAARLAHDCPHLEFGSIEIRQIEL